MLQYKERCIENHKNVLFTSYCGILWKFNHSSKSKSLTDWISQPTFYSAPVPWVMCLSHCLQETQQPVKGISMSDNLNSNYYLSKRLEAYCSFKRFFFFFFFLAVVGLCCCTQAFSACSRGAPLSWGARVSPYRGSSCGAASLARWASVAVTRRLSGGGAEASLLWGTWHLPGPGTEPGSPALQGRLNYWTTREAQNTCSSQVHMVHSLRLESGP